jgi:hypothetical protein
MSGDITTQRNIGSLLSPIFSVRPQSPAAGVVNGVSIDRQLHSMAGCCAVHSGIGAITGAPTTASVITKLQDSADNVTFADYLPDGANVAVLPALTAANAEGNLAVDLTLARRFIRAVSTVAFTGGTTPTAFTVTGIILSGENTLAAV